MHELFSNKNFSDSSHVNKTIHCLHDLLLVLERYKMFSKKEKIVEMIHFVEEIKKNVEDIDQEHEEHMRFAEFHERLEM